jgi:drug/metabolite transporter (DMT)-like permease
VVLPVALLRERPRLSRQLSLVGLAGVILFLAGGLQQAGLELTTAGNAGFITTLYVVFVPLILRIFWRERVGWVSWLAAGLAVAGSMLLSTSGTFRLSLGDALVLVSALFWALHVILIGKAVHRIGVLTLSAGQYLVAGVLNLVVGLALGKTLTGLTEGWWTIIYIGILSTTIGYTLQVLGQKYAPPTDAAILLSMEAVFAAMFGFIFLAESLAPVQIVGCVLILGAILLVQVKGSKL